MVRIGIEVANPQQDSWLFSISVISENSDEGFQNFFAVILSVPTYLRSASGITTLPSAC
jgi:hypothetical protein